MSHWDADVRPGCWLLLGLNIVLGVALWWAAYKL